MNGICMMVTRRKEAELARLAAAEEASRLKDEFLATLSHELRTPLNAILGWVQMLQSDSLAPERVKDAIQIIARNARLQAQLIEDILDVSRIITGKLETEHLPVLIPQLVESVIQGMQPAADAKHLVLKSEIADGLPPIDGDPRRLQQVLGNILSNAVKFTPDGGSIAISCRLRGDRIVITVRDTGIGIDQEFLPFIFDRFRQADSRSTRRHGGLGLGLAIARHLVAQHGGTIGAESEGPGRGTAFHIELPVGAPQGSAEPFAPGRAESVNLRSLGGTTVLLVDDQPDSLELLAQLFEGRGARVLKCESAEEALQLVHAQPVTLLVADIAMPEVDGFELLRRARRVRSDLPALAVSAYARPEDRHRAYSAGFNGYCAKPVDAADLLRLASKVLPT
jgi:CheY-like chemotaxis protein